MEDVDADPSAAAGPTEDDLVASIKSLEGCAVRSPGLESTLLEYQRQLAELRRQRAEAQPAWKQLRQLDPKLARKRKQLERGEATTSELEKAVREAEKTLSEHREKQSALQREVSELELEIAAVAGRVVGQEPPPGAAVAQALGQYSEEDLRQPELQRALTFAASVLQGAKQVAALRLQAAAASGSSELPAEESATPEEGRLVQEVREHHRQLAASTQHFQDSFSSMQLRMADAQSRLAALQRTRASAAAGGTDVPGGTVAAAGAAGAPSAPPLPGVGAPAGAPASG